MSLRYRKIWYEFSILTLEKVISKEIYCKINSFKDQLSFFETKNVVKISKNTYPPLQKIGDQVRIGTP